MDVVTNKKSFRIRSLELSKDNLSVADERFVKLSIPAWIDLSKQTHMISHPRNMKSHDWKQVC